VGQKHHKKEKELPLMIGKFLSGGGWANDRAPAGASPVEQ